jgi:NADPH:quinone reductase
MAVEMAELYWQALAVQVLAQGGSIATYATNASETEIPFWELVFANLRVFFVGSDDVPFGAK